ncbi:hypothetical protein T02_8049 [Trichinella nativa]|uniref:Uncharacterized protein n=1 Tax=Trichinella nativa TaxID=6335 RepID=A0A0V1KRE6_9BILA|nr:hypothetical protein T06_10333 [Trichinella sp. T6]KRZ49670.1 hypothetical protein T02_8049 [Trichinella nativa]
MVVESVVSIFGGWQMLEHVLLAFTFFNFESVPRLSFNCVIMRYDILHAQKLQNFKNNRCERETWKFLKIFITND